MRILLVEPNAVGLVGHPAAGVRGLAEAAAAAALEPVIAVNVAATADLRAVIPESLSLIRHTTFQERGAEDSFGEDLHNLASAHRLGPDDLVIVLTAHAHELRGLAGFVSDRSDAPTCHAVVHQLYPPAADYNETLGTAWRARSSAELGDALRRLQGSPVRVWTTASDGLRRSVAQLAGCEVAMLSLPMRSPSPARRDARGAVADGSPHFVFVGDNRYEKGLLSILDMILTRDDDWRFTLQVNHPRGYGMREMKIFESRVRMVRECANVTLVERALPDDELEELIAGATAVLLPYHPSSYDRRISAVLVQALALGVPPIVARGTWCSDYCDALGVGTAYERFADAERDAISLGNGVAAMLAERAYHERRARDVAVGVARANCGQAVLNTLLQRP